MPCCYIGPNLLCISKQWLKIFVKARPCILSFFASHYQMNLTSLTANRYVYSDLFAVDGGGFIWAHKFWLSWVNKFLIFGESLGQVILHLDALNFEFYQSLI